MKAIILLLLLTGLSVFAGPKEEIQQLRNKIHMQLTVERLKAIKTNSELQELHNNILRGHKSLAKMLNNHPEIKKSTLKEPALTELKLKLLSQDEDLRELKDILVKRHRQLEQKLLTVTIIKELTDKVDLLDMRLEQLRR